MADSSISLEDAPMFFFLGCTYRIENDLHQHQLNHSVHVIGLIWANHIQSISSCSYSHIRIMSCCVNQSDIWRSFPFLHPHPKYTPKKSRCLPKSGDAHRSGMSGRRLPNDNKIPSKFTRQQLFYCKKKKKNLGKTSKCLSEFKQCNSFKTLNWQRCQWLDSWMSSSVSLLLFNFIHPIGEPNETFVTEICSCHHSHHKGDYYKKPLHGGSNFLLQNKSSLQQSSN
jgi:hypothetical protein